MGGPHPLPARNPVPITVPLGLDACEPRMGIRWTTKIVLFKREQSSAGHEQCRRGMGIGSRWTRRGWSLASEPIVGTERSPDMDGTADTVIIGAGQVGLAMSWCLRDRPIASRPPRPRNVAAQRAIHPRRDQRDSALNTALDLRAGKRRAFP